MQFQGLNLLIVRIETNIGTGRGDLPDSDFAYFLSESEPEEAGRYWHYVDGVPTLW